jgi:hypothetical protein
MNSITHDIANGNEVTVNEVKYVLWSALCQLQACGAESLVDIEVADETAYYSIDSMLDQLDLDLGLLPGGGE